MGNHLWLDYADDQLEVNHPGCIWGIFHSLDYHQWHHNVKKILPHKKHSGGKRAKRDRSPKTRLNAYNSDEVQKLLDGEASHFLVNQSTTETSSTHKRSLKARIKALVSEENCKEEVHKRRGSSFPPRLQRTFSLRHLEPSDERLDKINTKWTHPIIFLPKNTESATKFQDLGRLKKTENLVGHKQKSDTCGVENDVDKLEHKDYVGVLEIFKVNKALFQQFIRSTDDDTGNCFHEPQVSKAKARLMKSGSFPVADSSHGGTLRPSKLKFRKSESWSFRKVDELLAGTRASKVVASKFAKDLSDNQETGISLGSTQESDNQESNEVGKPLKDNSPSDGSVDDLSKAKHAHFRRTSSLNKSLEKYACFFDYSFTHKAKSNLSKSLRLTNEYEIPSGGHAPISFRRIRSLPHLDIFDLPQNEESNDSHFSGNDEENLVGRSASAEKFIRIDANEGIESLNSMVQRSNISQRLEDSVSFKEGKSNEVSPIIDELSEKMDPQEELEKNSTEFQVSEDLEHICVNEDSLDQSDRVFSPDSCSTMYPDILENDKHVFKNCIHDDQCMDNADFNYVEAILELSGFTENGFGATWHSPDQPLSPAVFEELEACWPHKPETSEDNIVGCCHHEHLFDLVNEVLVQIYERSFTYYPKTLSSTCRIQTVPMGNRVLEEVWQRIIGPPSVGAKIEQSLDSLVSQDFAKDDGWMNLQMESECVGLELEDLIFDELLEEIMGY
ncbi:hypothetical protein LguiB_031190 [Lonicera macranthoides]